MRGKNTKKAIRRVLSFLLVVLMVITILPGGYMQVYAEETEIISLEKITNVGWKEESTATAIWDVVEGANYYSVIVIVYYNDVEYGRLETGTADTELDLQQEIGKITDNLEYDMVEVSYMVRAVVKGEQDLYGDFSDESSRITYHEQLIVLDIPQNVRITADYVVEWECVENTTEYSIKYEIGDGITGRLNWVKVKATAENCRDGIIKQDISSGLANWYQEIAGNLTGMCYVKAQVYACAEKGSGYCDSEYSDFSNAVEYSTELKKLKIPRNVRIDEKYTVEWETVENTIEYFIKYEIGDGITGRLHWVKVKATAENCRDGIAKQDISSELANSYQEIAGDLIGTCYVKAQVYACAEKGSGYCDSEYSDFSNVVEYSMELKKLKIPQNVRIDEKYMVEWECVENTTEYSIKYEIGDGITGRLHWVKVKATAENCRDGIVKQDISSELANWYQEIAGDLTGTCYVKAQVYACAEKGSGYCDSEYSDFSNVVEYRVNKIEELYLCPLAPIVCIDRELYLGKTIYPEDAYYDTIVWSSDNENVVSVDDMGCITGISVGTANITARIDDVTASIPVTVYTIDSNIEDEEEKQDVTDMAGGIIDDIANNDNPCLDNTDIDSEGTDGIRNEIHDAIEDGNTFHTDVKAIEKYFNEYKTNWGQIQKAARDLNAQFAGAYNIEVEIYHKDNGGVEHHIGNITELNDEITFTFDLPTGMKEQQSGDTKKYVLIRIHKNVHEEIEYDVIPYKINDDGTFSAKSDKYSDFVWVEVNEECNIVTEPIDQRVVEGKQAVFEVVANGTGLNYQWKVSANNGKSWITPNASTAKTATYRFNTKINQDGYLLKCIITDVNGMQVETNVVKLTVDQKPTMIEGQPVSQTVAVGEKATFKVNVLGEDITYQWKVSTNNGKTWVIPGASSSKTDTYIFTSRAAQNGYLLKCIITDAKGTQEETNEVKLTVVGTFPLINEQPVDQAAIVGKKVSFRVGALGDGLTYQWKVSTNNGRSWIVPNAASSKTATYVFTTKSTQNGYWLKCEITDEKGRKVETNVVKMIVK